MEKTDILLIHTPGASPAIPCLNSALVAGCLKKNDIDCLHYDANLDFFLNHVLSKDRLDHYFEMIKKKQASGIFSDTDYNLIMQTCHRIAKSSVSMDILRTLAFYEPEEFLAVKNHIDDFLFCFSSAFFPYKIQWSSFLTPADLFKEASCENPFALFCKEDFNKRILKTDPDTIVFFINSPGQVMAGETMAEHLKSNFPGKKIIFLNKIKINPDIVPKPVFNGLALNEYLSPVFYGSGENIFYEYYYDEKNLNTEGKDLADSIFQTYDRVAKLPGEAFWKVLEDPVYIWLYLKKYKKKKLFSMRAVQRRTSVITLGTHIRYYYKKPRDLPSGFMDEICRMVEAGGSVDGRYVRHNLERAFLIGYAMENNIIIGNSSLKHPRQEFIERVSGITGLDFNNFLERGYTSVRPEYRSMGVGARLLAGLTQRAGNHRIFSIISEDNKATQKIALKTRTRKIMTYYSEKLGKELGVWMPEHMIENNWKAVK